MKAIKQFNSYEFNNMYLVAKSKDIAMFIYLFTNRIQSSFQIDHYKKQFEYQSINN